LSPHIDSVNADIAWDLDLIARHLDATPLIVGERARDAELESAESVLQYAYGLFAISPETPSTNYFVGRGLTAGSMHRPAGLYVKD